MILENKMSMPEFELQCFYATDNNGNAHFIYYNFVESFYLDLLRQQSTGRISRVSEDFIVFDNGYPIGFTDKVTGIVYQGDLKDPNEIRVMFPEYFI